MLHKLNIFLNSIRFSPLVFLLFLKTKVFKDSYAMLFLKDMHRYNLSIWELLLVRPYYKMILYHRLGRCAMPLKLLCGTYPLEISDKKDMYIGGGYGGEHPFNSYINAIKVGSHLSINHNVTIGCNGGG